MSNIGDGTAQVVELDGGKLQSLGTVKVGAAPKRVAWIPPS
ncbi:MAG: hypothetical protein AB7S70_08040 [Hyphomicrobium sp.]